MHHPNYEQPLLIAWLCPRHHANWHFASRRVLDFLFQGWLSLQKSAWADAREGRLSPQELDANDLLLAELAGSPEQTAQLLCMFASRAEQEEAAARLARAS
jgi:hypothetical protein